MSTSEEQPSKIIHMDVVKMVHEEVVPHEMRDLHVEIFNILRSSTSGPEEILSTLSLLMGEFLALFSPESSLDDNAEKVFSMTGQYAHVMSRAHKLAEEARRDLAR